MKSQSAQRPERSPAILVTRRLSFDPVSHHVCGTTDLTEKARQTVKFNVLCDSACEVASNLLTGMPKA